MITVTTLASLTLTLPAVLPALTGPAPLTGATPLAVSGATVQTLGLIALMIVAFYFLIIRPQRKRTQELQKTMNALVPGTRVMTGSGLFGTIVQIGNKQAVLEISPGVELTVLKQAIARVATAADEDEPGSDDDDDAADEDADDARATGSVLLDEQVVEPELVIDDDPNPNGPDSYGSDRRRSGSDAPAKE